MLRSRKLYFFLIIITVGLGLASRRIPILPQWVHLYIGDVLWALMVFWIVGYIFKRKSTGFVVVLSIAFSLFIEFSQLYHAEWIDTIRSTTLGGLVLGFGFLWSDVICYTIGISMGLLMEKFFLQKQHYKKI